MLEYHLLPDQLYVYVKRDLDTESMPYNDVAKHVTVTKTSMIDKMPGGYGTV